MRRQVRCRLAAMFRGRTGRWTSPLPRYAFYCIRRQNKNARPEEGARLGLSVRLEGGDCLLEIREDLEELREAGLVESLGDASLRAEQLDVFLHAAFAAAIHRL